MSKDTDVKAYIFHPITKRWEGLLFSVIYTTNNTSSGIGVHSTSEGIIVISGQWEVIDGDGVINQDNSYTHMNSGPKDNKAKTAILVTYNGVTINN